MDVSIIIVNYKNKGLIRHQLRSFVSQPITLNVEIIVVDNNSNDGIGEMLAHEFPQVTFIAAPTNRGYGAGNNLGIARSSGKYLLIANPDIVLTAEMVSGLHAFMESHPQVGIAGPRITNADGTLQYSCVRFPDFWLPVFRRTTFAKTKRGERWLDWYFMKSWDHATPQAVDWLFGSCLCVRRSALDTVGMFDERFFLYLEDTDWCRRFWEQSYEVYYVPQVAAVHLLSRSSEVSIVGALFSRHARAHLLSFLKYQLKYWGKQNPHKAENP